MLATLLKVVDIASTQLRYTFPPNIDHWRRGLEKTPLCTIVLSILGVMAPRQSLGRTCRLGPCTLWGRASLPKRPR